MKLDREVLSVLVGVSIAVSLLGLWALFSGGPGGYSYLGLAGPDGSVETIPRTAYRGQTLHLTVYVGNENDSPRLYRVEAYWVDPDDRERVAEAWTGMVMVDAGGEESLPVAIPVSVGEGDWMILFILSEYDGYSWKTSVEEASILVSVGG